MSKAKSRMYCLVNLAGGHRKRIEWSLYLFEKSQSVRSRGHSNKN